MKTRQLLQAVLCASTLALGAATLGSSVWAQEPDAQERSTAQSILSIREVYDVLEKQGYRNFTEIDLEQRKRGRSEEYEVKADNASGETVKLRVDAANGNVLDERSRSEARRRDGRKEWQKEGRKEGRRDGRKEGRDKSGRSDRPEHRRN